MRLFAASLLIATAFIVGLGFNMSGAGAQQNQSQPKLVPTPLRYVTPVVFILSLGEDATTNSDVAVALARRLQHPTTPSGEQTAFVPQGTWSLNDFIEQCSEFPDEVKGAVVVLPSSYQSTNDNYLLMIRNQSKIAYNVMMVTCTPTAQLPSAPSAGGPGKSSNGTPQVGWVSGVAEGNYGHSEIQFLPLAALTSVYLAFAPQRVYQTVSNRVIPTPNPLPPGGFTNSISTTQSTTLNSSSTATLQNNVVSAAGIAALLFGRGGSSEHFTVHAAEDAAADFVQNQLQIRCPGWRGAKLPPTPVASPTATPIAEPATSDGVAAAEKQLGLPADAGPGVVPATPAPVALSTPAFCSW